MRRKPLSAIERAWRAASPEARRIMANADFGAALSLAEALGLARLAVEIEPDDAGHHAVIIDVADDAVLHVSNSYDSPDRAAAAARAWIDRNQ